MKISDIGDNRLVRILAGDKGQNPDKICNLMASDIKKILECYIELDGDIEIEMTQNDEVFYFDIKAKASRMKCIGILS